MNGRKGTGAMLAAAGALVLGVSAPAFAAKIVPGWDLPIPKIPQQLRFAGATPSAVSTEIATKMVQQGDSGHIALFAVGGTSWQDQAEILEADPLASADQGVILLTPSQTGLGVAVTQWVRAHHVRTAVLIGAANTPALHRALARLGVKHFQGLGTANPVTTGAAVARALRGAMNEDSLPGAIVMMPNDIADSIAAASAAAYYEVPIIVANPYTRGMTTTIPAVEWHAIQGPYMSTIYAVGELGVRGSLQHIPSSVDVLSLGGANPYQSTTAIDEHFIVAGEAGVVVMNTPVGLTEGAAAGAFAGGAINQIQPELAPILLAQPGRYPMTLGMDRYVSTFDPNMWTSIGVGSQVTPGVLATFRHDAGHTAMAQLANRAIRVEIQNAEYADEFMPPNPLLPPNNTPEVGSQNMVQSNYAGWRNKYAPGGPIMPVTLRSVGLHNLPPNGAILGLTAAVREKLLAQAAQQPLLAPLTTTPQGQQLLLQAVREAARNEINYNTLEQALQQALDTNNESAYNANANLHDLEVDPADAIANWVAGAQSFGANYRAWVVVQPNVTITTAPLAAGPVGAVRNTVAVKGITLYIIASAMSNNHQHFGIGEFKAPNLSGMTVDEITANGLTRWYADENAAFNSSLVKVLWMSPKNYGAATKHWPNPLSYLQ